ncbi:MAG: hypothetical protein M3R24_06610 [Chloroflexota bacterium]|nr:hypothetical protein [Chloroflexota bacterium]
MPIINYPVFVYRGAGLEFEVYQDRIEVTSRKRLRQQTITHPLARITRVEVKGAPAQLHLMLDDGATTAYPLSGHGAAARDAIMRLMSSVDR